MGRKSAREPRAGMTRTEMQWLSHYRNCRDQLGPITLFSVLGVFALVCNPGNANNHFALAGVEHFDAACAS